MKKKKYIIKLFLKNIPFFHSIHKISIHSFLSIIQISQCKTRRNSTYPVCNNVSKRWIDFFPNKMLLRICFKISNSCSSTYSWPSNAGKVNAFVISDLKHSTTRGKMCARARANRSSTYFSPHSSIIHFQLYAWLPSRLFFARDTLDSSIRIPDRETWRVLRTARILSVLSTPFTFNPVIIISITISKIGKI